MRHPQFRIYQDKAGEWRWRLKTANGWIVADSGEGYSDKRGVLRAIAAVRRAAGLAVVRP